MLHLFARNTLLRFTTLNHHQQMLDLDVSVSLLHEAQQGLGLPFLPHFTYEDLDLFGGGYIAECHMPAFLQLPATSDTDAMIVVSDSSNVLALLYSYIMYTAQQSMIV
jgi:hypothetical protein